MATDFITKKAKRLITYHLDQGISQYKEVNSAIDDDLRELDENDEKVKYLQIISEKVNFDYAEHKLVCEDPENCSKNWAYDHILYFIQKELKDLGVRFNDDTFTREEKETAENKIDKILSELNDIKYSQKISYELLTEQLEELKEIFYLGKQKWHQLLVGKSVEMVVSGIVSETVCKQIISEFNQNVLPLLK
ncbi:MAG: hypothetical protein V4539_01210 [Bacteroidota bacterium]